MKAEIRSNGEVFISGYVNAVERDSRAMPMSICGKAGNRFVERVRAGTFDKALKKGETIELRFNHERVIGDNKTNLTLYEDNIGLKAEAVVKDPAVIEKAKKGELRGWSFGFYCNGDCWEAAEEGTERRILNDITLKEVSILDITPAYIATSVELRSGAEEMVSYEKRGVTDSCIVSDSPAEDKTAKNNSDYCRYAVELLKLKG